jgi:D,D-heptose 1,7-bisphosphate phosphatase
MRVLILAGGFGTRLSSVLKDLPKSMAPIGKKPFLEFLIYIIKNQGFRDIVLSTGYKSDVIEDYFRDGTAFGVNISYSRESKPLGTGGAIRVAAENYPDDNYLVLNGDTFFDADYSCLMDFHKKSRSLLTIALKYKEDVKRYGCIEVQGDRIISFSEKNDRLRDGYINAGVMVLSREALPFFKKKETLSLEKEVMPLLLKENALSGLPFGGKFIDIGIPDDYFAASKNLPAWLSEPKIKVAFLDRDGIINEDAGYTYKVDDLKLVEGLIPFLSGLQKMGFKLIIITNQAGIGKGLFRSEDYLAFQEKLIKILNAEGIGILDSFYSPYHRDASLKKFRRESLLRKPGPGMALLAADKHNIDLAKSVMIGDRDSDRLELPYLHSYIKRGKYGNDPSLKTYLNFDEILEAIKNG